MQFNVRRCLTFSVNTGNQQGCTAFPELFNSAIDCIETWMTNRLGFSFQFGDWSLTVADDIALVAETVEKVIEALCVLSEQALNPADQLAENQSYTHRAPTSLSNVKKDNIRSNSINLAEDLTYLGSSHIQNACSVGVFFSREDVL